MGKLGLYVPPTLAVLTAAPRAFAVSPEPPSGSVTISGTFSSTYQPSSYPYGGLTGYQGASKGRHCGPINTAFSLTLTSFDPTQNLDILVLVMTDATCSSPANPNSLWVSGPDAARGTVSGLYWQVGAGAIALGEDLQVNFAIS